MEKILHQKHKKEKKLQAMSFDRNCFLHDKQTFFGSAYDDITDNIAVQTKAIEEEEAR